MKSIKSKLLLLITTLVTVIIVGITSLALITASNSLQNTAKKTMGAMVTQGAAVVESRINRQLSVLETLASDDFMADSSLSTDEKLSRFSQAIEKNGYLKMGIADLGGNITFSNNTNTNIADRDYFKAALEGKSYASDPLMSKADGTIVVVYATPLLQDGNVVGVLTVTMDGNEISNIVKDITFGETGKAFMLNSTGIKIAHYDEDLVINQDNDLDNVEEDPNLKTLVALETKMINGEKGEGIFTYGGEKKLLTFSPVNGTNWSLAITVETNEVLSELNTLKIVSIFLAIIFLIISFILVYIISDSITKRIKLAINYINPISSGDFSHAIADKHLKIKDEIGQMIQAIQTMQRSVKEMLQLVLSNSNKIDEDTQSLSAVSQQMSASSNIMANSIEEITKGTILQSESLGTITESLSVFSNNIEHITNDINAVEINAKEIKKFSNDSNENMQNIAKSVEITNDAFSKFETGIDNLSTNINKINDITNLINAISEQTNLLSLNAAIEAARAGESGKGFAVVADEIRKLAEQSRNSSTNISSLINDIYSENTIMIAATQSVSKEFANQSDVIHSSVTSFAHIVNAVDEIIPKIETVTELTSNLNEEKRGILDKIGDISAVSEETSASSEEISASTEEIANSSEEVAGSAVNLSSKTKEMMQAVSKFKL